MYSSVTHSYIFCAPSVDFRFGAQLGTIPGMEATQVGSRRVECIAGRIESSIPSSA